MSPHSCRYCGSPLQHPVIELLLRREVCEGRSMV
jgi:hypothetical protein